MRVVRSDGEQGQQVPEHRMDTPRQWRSTNDRSARFSLSALQGCTVRRARSLHFGRRLIRTLGVGLIALAAIVASLTVVKRQEEEARPAEGEKRPQNQHASSGVDLDQLRAAGM